MSEQRPKTELGWGGSLILLAGFVLLMLIPPVRDILMAIGAIVLLPTVLVAIFWPIAGLLLLFQKGH